MDPPIIYDPSKHLYLIPSLVTLHSACITTEPYTIATFLPPLSPQVMTAWWESRSKEVLGGNRHIVLQLARNPDTGVEEVAGVVMLSFGETQTGPFRGSIEKLLVLPWQRQKGIAKRLMLRVEDIARQCGKWLLMLDTEVGSPAEYIYPKMGYTAVGVIPDHEISPKDGKLRDGLLFYKDLRPKS